MRRTERLKITAEYNHPAVNPPAVVAGHWEIIEFEDLGAGDIFRIWEDGEYCNHFGSEEFIVGVALSYPRLLSECAETWRLDVIENGYGIEALHLTGFSECFRHYHPTAKPPSKPVEANETVMTELRAGLAGVLGIKPWGRRVSMVSTCDCINPKAAAALKGGEWVCPICDAPYVHPETAKGYRRGELCECATSTAARDATTGIVKCLECGRPTPQEPPKKEPSYCKCNPSARTTFFDPIVDAWRCKFCRMSIDPASASGCKVDVGGVEGFVQPQRLSLSDTCECKPPRTVVVSPESGKLLCVDCGKRTEDVYNQPKVEHCKCTGPRGMVPHPSSGSTICLECGLPIADSPPLTLGEVERCDCEDRPPITPERETEEYLCIACGLPAQLGERSRVVLDKGQLPKGRKEEQGEHCNCPSPSLSDGERGYKCLACGNPFRVR